MSAPTSVPFSRAPQRFVSQGLCLNAPLDLLPEGKSPLLANVRSYHAGQIEPRAGLVAVAGASFGGAAIHSIARLNDPIAGATATAWHVFGASNKIYAGAPGGGAFPQIDTGYSGDPLTLFPYTPIRCPEPWIYVADRTRMRKFDVNGHVYPVGIAPPATPPSVVLSPLGTTLIDDYTVPWVNAGTAAGALAALNRVNTTISAIYYDAGASGYASIVPVSMDGIGERMLLKVGGAEYAAVTQVTVAVAATTIAAILYDAGASGLCTIQPTASLGTGQLESPSFADYQARAPLPPGAVGRAFPRGAAGTPSGPSPDLAPRLRQIDFPVNCLVALSGPAETVRILSVALGPDGVQSFRCSTAGTHHAGDTITGVAAFRIGLAGAYGGGASLVSGAMTNTLTPSAPAGVIGALAVATAGIKSPPGWAGVNLAQVGGRATLDGDDLHLAFRSNDCTVIRTVRLYLDVDPVLNDYTQNYFFHEWRASDILAAIQSINTAQVTPLAVAQEASAGARQADATARRATMGTPTGGVAVPRPGTTGTGTTAPGTLATGTLGPRPRPGSTSVAGTAGAASTQAGLGNNQWLELSCKIRDLVHVGGDPSRTLAHVKAAEILISVASVTTTPVTVAYDTAWISGGYGPDVGPLGVPFVYWYRYRSALTGAKSNPSPASRGGVAPQRQQVLTTGVQSPDGQVDLVDWFRQGGTLTTATYVGTGPNSNPPTLADAYPDQNLDGGESLGVANFQPWPTSDLPRTGTCDVAGTAVARTGGANFNPAWAPGTPIVVNGRTCTVAQIVSASLLHVNENAGSGSGVPFSLTNPTIQGVALPALWGPDLQGSVFACGDPNNPSTLYWSTPGDLDTCSDANSLEVTSGSERLQTGFVWDHQVFVASTEQLYAVQSLTGPGGLTYYAAVTPCGTGFWTRWAWALSPQGIYFLAKDGIYRTTGGPAESITDRDLYPLFPHDGRPGVTVNTVVPPDLAQTTRLRLSYINGWLYFDYLDTGGGSHTLAYREADSSWWFDTYAVGVTARLSEPGAGVSEELIGGVTGLAYTPGTLADNGTAYTCQYRVGAFDGGDPRSRKLWGDLIVDVDAAGAVGGLTVQPSFNTFTILPAPTVVGAGVSGRGTYVVEVGGGLGTLARNAAVDLSWSSTVVAPTLYLWEPAFIPKGELTDQRASDWEDAGSPGSKYVNGIILRGDTANVAKAFSIQHDGGSLGPYNVTLNGEADTTIAFATPVVTRLLRLTSADAVLWAPYTWAWLFDPYPELAPLVPDYSDAGYFGTKYVHGVKVEADTLNLPVSVQIQADGAAVGSPWVVTANGRQELVQAVTPFLAQELRLVPASAWRKFKETWIYDEYPDSAALTSSWMDGGYQGAKFVQGVVLYADTGGAAVSVQVQSDGGVVQQTLSLTHTGQSGIAYPLAPGGWTPFMAHLVRLVALGACRIFWDKTQWIFEPAPELATEWHAQPTTFDLPGYFSVFDLVVGHQSTQDLTVSLDGGASYPYTIPHSAGAYARTRIPLRANKQLAVEPVIKMTQPGRIYKRDCAMRIQGWGIPGGYRVVNPFGGPSRVDGAAV